MEASLLHLSSFVANSFCDLVRPIESHSRKNIRKNTVGPNEFTDFENFGFEHPRRCKTMFHVNSAKTPRYRYYVYSQHLAAGARTPWGMYLWQGHPSRPWPRIVCTSRAKKQNNLKERQHCQPICSRQAEPKRFAMDAACDNTRSWHDKGPQSKPWRGSTSTFAPEDKPKSLTQRHPVWETNALQTKRKEAWLTSGSQRQTQKKYIAIGSQNLNQLINQVN